jgi:hypothetical protein
MPSIKKVQDWYAQSFEVCVHAFMPLALVTGAHVLRRKSSTCPDQLFLKKSKLASYGLER